MLVNSARSVDYACVALRPMCIGGCGYILMTSAISCPLWSSVNECHIVECTFTSSARTECGMFVMFCMQCCMSVSTVL